MFIHFLNKRKLYLKTILIKCKLYESMQNNFDFYKNCNLFHFFI